MAQKRNKQGGRTWEEKFSEATHSSRGEAVLFEGICAPRLHAARCFEQCMCPPLSVSISKVQQARMISLVTDECQREKDNLGKNPPYHGKEERER